MIVAGTGHRPNKLGGYGLDAKLKLVGLANDWLEANKPTKVISGMALGWDVALAVAALQLGIPLVAAIPFKGQELAWPSSSQKDYNDVLREASEIVYVSEEGYAPWKMQIRNEWMVDHCDLVLAIWNGTLGGTANCVRYAENVDKPIVNLWDKYCEE